MNSIRIQLSILLIVVLGNACQNNCDYQDVDKPVFEYIEYFRNLDTKKRNFMVRIIMDSSLTDYQAFRISTSPTLLSEDEVPNRFSVVKGMKVSFFTQHMTFLQTNEKRAELISKNFYNTSDGMIDSNYPEWVLYRLKANKCFTLTKNTQYQDLGEIVKQ